MHAWLNVEACCGHLLAEVAGVLLELIAEIGRRREHAQDLKRSACDRRWQSVAEEIWTRALAQHLDDLLTSRGKATGRTTKGLAKRRRNDIDPTYDVLVLD